MSDKIRMPGINAPDQAEKLEQIRSYLYQLADQLNRLLDGISAPADSVSTEDAHLTFSRLRPLIMQSAEIADAYGQRLKSLFPTKDSLPQIESYTFPIEGDLTVQSQPVDWGAGEPCQNFLVFGHSRGSAVLAALTMYGQSSLLCTGNVQARVTSDGQFSIFGVTGDRLTLISPEPFTIKEDL